MEDLKGLIIDYFTNNKKNYTKEELRKNLNIKGEQQTTIFNCALMSLVEDGCLFFDEKNIYKLFTNDMGLAYGELQINKNGVGFVHTKDGYTILIENCDLKGGLDGDLVIVSSINNNRKDFYSGEIYKVLKRKNGNVIFEVIGNGKDATLLPHGNLSNISVNIKKNELKNLLDGELIKVKVGTEYIEGEYTATIDRVIGHRDDPNIDIKLLADKYDININFSSEALEEANNIKKVVDDDDLNGRVDLRDKNIITIDCDNTKDRDDAVYVEKLENGNYKLFTSISSVNYYIKKGMKLYEEAQERCTSHYPNNSCIPMFPHVISNGICSLNENVDRLTKTCEMEITELGEIIDIKVYNSVINSKKAMKYSEVNEILKGNMIDEYEPFREQLKLMEDLSNILNLKREMRNCMDFDLPDIQVIQDNEGLPIDFKESGCGTAEKIIENFMLVTNNSIAEYYSWMPIIYRVHECPEPNTVKNVIEILIESGIKIPKIQNVSEKSIKSILDKIKTLDEARIIQAILLRSMKRAKYDTANLGHFALQLDNYCHFTSPIRRISDFMTHAVIDLLESGNFDFNNYQALEKEMKTISENASIAERIDQAMENEATMMAMAEYMQSHIGDVFDAYVTDISGSGMFVITSNSITGKVKIDDIEDDKYRYDKNKHILIGKNNKKVFKLGSKICVLVKEASKENRTINFEIPKQKSLR